MNTDGTSVAIEPQWADKFHIAAPPYQHRGQARGHAPGPQTYGTAAAALPHHVASLPYLSDRTAENSMSASQSTPYIGSHATRSTPAAPHSAPIPAQLGTDRRYHDQNTIVSTGNRNQEFEGMTHSQSLGPREFYTTGTMNPGPSPITASTSRNARAPYTDPYGASMAPSDPLVWSKPHDLSRSRQASSGSLARSFASEEDSKYQSPASKPLAAAANRVAGTFSRLTRLHKRPQARGTQPTSPYSPELSLRTERDAMNHAPRIDPLSFSSRTENLSITSLDTSSPEMPSERSFSRHTRGTSERSQASSGGSLVLRDPVNSAPIPDTFDAVHRNVSRAPSRNELQMNEAHFERLELIGRGAFGAVYRAKHLPSNTLVALKVIDLDTPDDDVSEIQREVALLSQMRQAHLKNIVRYWGCWLSGPTLCILMDYAEGGSVRTLMKAGQIQERHLAVIMRETLVALDYIHKAGIIHRDIKAANILVTRTGQPMLCDFGIAASFVQGGTRGKRSTFIGTPYWMAPEVISEGKTYDYKADIWSLGITAYEIATGNPPHADQAQHQVIAMIPRNAPPRLPDGPYSPALREFVAACLDEDPNARLSAEELMRLKWIRSHGKTPISVLRELLAQYASWTKAGGVRTSLIQGKDGPLALRLAIEEPSVVPIEPEWKFHSTESSDVDADVETTLASEPVQQPDHPLKRLFDKTEDATSPSKTPLSDTSVSKSSQPKVSTIVNPKAPTPTPLSDSQASRSNRPAGTGFTGAGVTPFRFGIGSRATNPLSDPKPEKENEPVQDAHPELAKPDQKNETAAKAPPMTPASPPSSTSDGKARSSSQANPNSSSHELDSAPSPTQSNSADLPGTPDTSSNATPVLRRVSRFTTSKPIHAQHPTLRMAVSSSSLMNETYASSMEEARKSEGSKSTNGPSFLEEPFSGFRPQGAISRTRSRSGSVADLRSRAYAHSATQSLTSRTRLAPIPSLNITTDEADTSGKKLREASEDDTATVLPSSGSLSKLPVPDDSAHHRDQHGGSDPTLISTPQLQSSQPLYLSDPPTPDLLRESKKGLVSTLKPLSLANEKRDVFQDNTTSTLFEGPALRSLDFAGLMNRQELHTELTQIVEDLGSWLDVLTFGIDRVLSPPIPRT
ncbi:kinase that interacts with cdc31p [Malassezia psittaci]|uniref:non-specific serine/threonine protein kinase n=1 Tax=Malassezia psittaci TaxID=1821823 RepID=A0AAF0FBL7_9BASI|nr:kinase that interacts with cdc31p [Malassezia psittaci]